VGRRAGNARIAAEKQQLAAGIAQINSLPIPASQKAALIAKANAQFEAQLAAAGVPASGAFPTSFPTLGAKGTLKFPQYAVLGYSFRPTPEWNIEADIDWTDWDSLNDVTLKRSDGSGPEGAIRLDALIHLRGGSDPHDRGVQVERRLHV